MAIPSNNSAPLNRVIGFGAQKTFTHPGVAQTRNPVVSVVIPMLNEAESVDVLIARLQPLLDHTEVDWEFVMVNDGSSDTTQEKLESALPGFARCKLVQLSRNFGQQAAYRAGLEQATGDAVVFLDADLQDPPEMIPDMIAEWRAGAKLVTGCRKSRPERGLRGLLLRGFQQIFFRLTGGIMPRNSGTFGLMDRVVADHVRAMPEQNLFLPALRCWVGYQHATVWYDRSGRAVGEPKQSLRKLFAYAWDGITSFSEIPLKAITLLGVLFSSCGFLYACTLVAVKLLQAFGLLAQLQVLGFTTLAVAIIAFGGIQLICIGVIGEYVARIYREVKRRPHFIVETVQQFSHVHHE
jgi:glycosyltransferase involved in cell wall biosynthesis